MRPSSRLVLVFATLIVVMVVAAIILVFSLGKTPALLPADTPVGVVQRFLIALESNDYVSANQYLSPSNSLGPLSRPNPAGDQLPPVASQYYMENAWQGTITGSVIDSNGATVFVKFEVPMSSGFFSSAVFDNFVSYSLVRAGSTWLITAQGFSPQ